MRRLVTVTTALAVLVLAAEWNFAQAQITRPNQQYYSRLNPAGRAINRSRPRTSPYLSLLQTSGGALGFGVPNYQALVQPQLRQNRQNNQVNRQLNQLQGQVGGLARAISPGSLGIAGGAIRPTGRPAGSAGLAMYYGNTAHYYGNRLNLRSAGR